MKAIDWLISDHQKGEPFELSTGYFQTFSLDFSQRGNIAHRTGFLPNLNSGLGKFIYKTCHTKHPCFLISLLFQLKVDLTGLIATAVRLLTDPNTVLCLISGVGKSKGQAGIYWGNFQASF